MASPLNASVNGARLRYVAREAEHTTTAEARTEAQVWLQKATTLPPLPPPYTFTGMVRDSRRNPVSAEIWLYSKGSPIDDRRGTGFTDSSGRYTVTLQRTAQSAR